MSRHKYMLWCIVLNLANVALCNVLAAKKDQCKEICNDHYFLLPLVKEASLICQRGCRLFNIIDAEGNLEVNKSKKECHESCSDAYADKKTEACSFGCNIMEKKRVSDISSSFLVFIEQEGQNNIMVVQPELEQIDVDVLSDPGVRNQLELGYSLEYKIPETHIRTMPIGAALENKYSGMQSDLTMKQYQPTGDWLDCASRNSGIPRWILVSAVLLAVLIGIWLIFASDKHETMMPPVETPEPVLINDLEYSAPPKYSLESEKV